MEKLVEEIAKTIWATDPIYYDFLAEPTKRLAREIITRIGEAYADGELELPGEVGRLEENPTARHQIVSGCGDCQKISVGLRQWIISQFNGGARTFIALRKGEDMPKQLSNEITKGQRP